MHILVVDEEIPLPPNSGKRIRSSELIKRLSQHHSVAYLAYDQSRASVADAVDALGLHDVHLVAHRDVSLPRKYAGALANVFQRWPYSVVSHFSREFQQALDRLVAETAPDLIIAEWTPYLQFVRDVRRVPVIAATHNVEGQIWERHAQVNKGPLRWFYREQARKMIAFEKAALSACTGVTAVSEDDADQFRGWGVPGSIDVVPNGVDTAAFTPGYFSSSPCKICFVGSMDWMPNQDAVQYFYESVMPLLDARDLDYSFVVIGRNPPAGIRSMAEAEKVVITGTVDDVRDHLAGATVCVVPLRVGGGSRLKILEAQACGIPVVATTIGAEGLTLEDGEEILIADSPSEICDAIVKVAEDDQLSRRLIEAGRSAVERSYSWDSIASDYLEFIDRVVGSFRGELLPENGAEPPDQANA